MSNPHTSAVPGEGIDLIGGGGGGGGGSNHSGGVASVGPHGCRTGSSALRVSLGAPEGLVTSSHALASMAGNRILLKGGNAFDATAAIISVLNVVEPMSSSIAGNGFLTLWDAQTEQVQSLNMVGASPQKVDASTMTPEELAQGPKAAVVPGVLGGICDLLSKYGTMSLGETMESAIQYASKGHPISEALLAAVQAQEPTLKEYPTSHQLFCQPVVPHQVGQIVYNHDLARTMQTLVHAETTALEKGQSRSEALEAACDCFYKGPIAQQCIDWFDQHGGLLTLDDFQYHRSSATPRWEEPLHTTYKGYDIYANGHTSRGGLETLMNLNVLEQLEDLEKEDIEDNEDNMMFRKDPQCNPDLLHHMVETIKVVKSCIYQYMGDPKFTHTPTPQMLSKEYAQIMASTIHERQKALKETPSIVPEFPNSTTDNHNHNDNNHTPSTRFPEDYYDSPDTTSFSVVDTWGNCVCCTITIGEGFGTRCVVGDTGLLFNNGMRIGSTSPYPESVNYLQPRKVALINNAPILVLRDGQFLLSVGTPGGEAIGQVQTQTLVNLLDYQMSPQEAIEYPRFKLVATPNFYRSRASYSWKMEKRFPTDTVDDLQEEKGHDSIQRVGPYSICAVQTIVHGSFYQIIQNQHKKEETEEDPNTPPIQYGYTAGADPRGGYYAVGY